MASFITSKFDKIGDFVRQKFNKFTTKISYNFWDELTGKSVAGNKIATDANPRKAALQWFRDYSRNIDNKYQKRVMRPGLMYAFEYFDPLGKKTLEYYDRRPLDICIGSYLTKAGELREVAINLHFLPQKVRLIVMFQIFTMFRSRYKENLFEKDMKPVPVNWKAIVKPLKQFGIGFAIRSYVPNLKKNVIEIKQEDWKYAAYYQPNDFVRSDVVKLEEEWRKYVKKNNMKAVEGESHLK